MWLQTCKSDSIKVRCGLVPVPCGVISKRSGECIPVCGLCSVSSLVYGLPKSRLDIYQGLFGLENCADMSALYQAVSDSKENIRVDSGTEDELSAPSKSFRVTSWNSVAGQASHTGHDPTSYANVSSPWLIT